MTLLFKDIPLLGLNKLLGFLCGMFSIFLKQSLIWSFWSCVASGLYLQGEPLAFTVHSSRHPLILDYDNDMPKPSRVF